MLTQAELKDLLNYDAETGLFTRKTGDKAGCVRKDGYVSISVKNKRYLAHRLAWIYVYGDIEKPQIDHINGNPSDNRIVNLRQATHTENQQNQIRPHNRNKFGLIGVSFNKHANKFTSAISLENKTISLGLFETAELAHEAYLKAKRSLHTYGTI